MSVCLRHKIVASLLLTICVTTHFKKFRIAAARIYSLFSTWINIEMLNSSKAPLEMLPGRTHAEPKGK